jgi:DNA-binding NtrC family response regulator
MQRCKLNFINIATSSLRERREDIPLQGAHFLEVFNKKFGRQKQLTPPMLAMLAAHAWPGNVRELENIMERFTVLREEMCLEGGAVGADIAAGAGGRRPAGPGGRDRTRNPAECLSGVRQHPQNSQEARHQPGHDRAEAQKIRQRGRPDLIRHFTLNLEISTGHDGFTAMMRISPLK